MSAAPACSVRLTRSATARSLALSRESPAIPAPFEAIASKGHAATPIIVTRLARLAVSGRLLLRARFFLLIASKMRFNMVFLLVGGLRLPAPDHDAPRPNVLNPMI